MPTKPNEDFIPRAIEHEGLRRMLEFHSGKIKEVVNFSSWVFKWILESIESSGGKDETIPLLGSFRHIFELLDAISELIRISCIDPCKILLRSIFESLLSIEYILEQDSKRRGLDFMICYWHEDIKQYRRWDPDDQLHAEMLERKNNDMIMREWRFEGIPDVKNIKYAIEQKKKVFELPLYQDSESEYQRFREERRGKAKWYSLRGGPRSVKEMAERLRRPLQYDFLYGYFSESVHGTDLIRNKIEQISEDLISVAQLRLPRDTDFVAGMAMNFGLSVIRNFVENLIPEKRQELTIDTCINNVLYYGQEVSHETFRKPRSIGTPSVQSYGSLGRRTPAC